MIKLLVDIVRLSQNNLFDKIYSKMKTIKMKKVLIALDYDPTAQKVAEVGFSLAKTMDAEIILLHVISDPKYYVSEEHITIMGFAGYPKISQLQLNSVDELKMVSQHFLDRSKQHLGDETIQTLVKDGDYAESIIRTAEDLHVDIIIMGSHGRKWLEKIIIGSVTEKVLSHTSIPLFIIPTKKHN
jgi:nucleotide-binding universal stress UspA family protein